MGCTAPAQQRAAPAADGQSWHSVAADGMGTRVCSALVSPAAHGVPAAASLPGTERHHGGTRPQPGLQWPRPAARTRSGQRASGGHCAGGQRELSLAQATVRDRGQIVPVPRGLLLGLQVAGTARAALLCPGAAGCAEPPQLPCSASPRVPGAHRTAAAARRGPWLSLLAVSWQILSQNTALPGNMGFPIGPKTLFCLLPTLRGRLGGCLCLAFGALAPPWDDL